MLGARPASYDKLQPLQSSAAPAHLRRCQHVQQSIASLAAEEPSCDPPISHPAPPHGIAAAGSSSSTSAIIVEPSDHTAGSEASCTPSSPTLTTHPPPPHCCPTTSSPREHAPGIARRGHSLRCNAATHSCSPLPSAPRAARGPRLLPGAPALRQTSLRRRFGPGLRGHWQGGQLTRSQLQEQMWECLQQLRGSTPERLEASCMHLYREH